MCGKAGILFTSKTTLIFLKTKFMTLRLNQALFDSFSLIINTIISTDEKLFRIYKLILIIFQPLIAFLDFLKKIISNYIFS